MKRTYILLLAGLLFTTILVGAALAIDPAEHTTTLAFLGDVMLGRGVADIYTNGDWREAFGFLKDDLRSAGLAFANLESPVTSYPLVPLPSGEIPYDLRAEPASLEALVSAGIDWVSTANNHSLDAGTAGVEDTRSALEEAGIGEARPGVPQVFESGGLRIALIAYDDIRERMDIAQAEEAITKARTESDLVIISVHWGSEYDPAPTPRQGEIAERLTSAGADVIWGHHPHVLQPLQWIESGDRRTLVAYSLGNAIFDQQTPPDVLRSALLIVEVGKDGVQSYRIIPYVISRLTGRIEISPAGDEQKIITRLEGVAP